MHSFVKYIHILTSHRQVHRTHIHRQHTVTYQTDEASRLRK